MPMVMASSACPHTAGHQPGGGSDGGTECDPSAPGDAEALGHGASQANNRLRRAPSPPVATSARVGWGRRQRLRGLGQMSQHCSKRSNGRGRMAIPGKVTTPLPGADPTQAPSRRSGQLGEHPPKIRARVPGGAAVDGGKPPEQVRERSRATETRETYDRPAIPPRPATGRLSGPVRSVT